MNSVVKSFASRLQRVMKSQKTMGILSKLLYFVLLFGLAYVILFPFLVKITSSFMSKDDLYDNSVSLVPTKIVFDHYITILRDTTFFASLLTTLRYSVVVASCTVISSTLVGYGLGRYKFKGSKFLFFALIVTLIVPSVTLSIPLFSTFEFFDPFGLISLFTGSSLTLTNSVISQALLSLTCLGFKGGLFVILMQQFFRDVPAELTEAASVDGAGHLKTFFRVILPMARSMMVVVFILSFAWQWTDVFYSRILMGSTNLLSNMIRMIPSASYSSEERYVTHVLANTGVILMIIPLLIVYIIFQRQIVEGIERSGIVG